MTATETNLFKKFTKDSISQLAATKASDQKRIRQQLQDQYPCLEPYWEEIMPKKRDVMFVKCHDTVNLVTILPSCAEEHHEVLFFNHHDGDFFPHLKLLHKYPFMLPCHKVDIGGCKFVVSGANVMCPGLTSKGGAVCPSLPEGGFCGVTIEGKQHAVGVGVASMSSEAIVRVNKGPCITNIHCLGDGLWNMPVILPPA